MTPSTWLAGARPRRAIMITFDDGYADLVTHAFPVLARFGMSATVFVVTERLGGQDNWNDPLGSGDRFALLSEADLVRWQSQGMEFGSHGRSHRDLVALDPDARAPSSKAVAQTSRGSWAELRWPSRCIHTVSTMLVSSNLLARLTTLAFTIREGIHLESADPLRIARLQVLSRDSPFDLFLDVTFGSSLWNHLKGRLVELRQKLLNESERRTFRAGTPDAHDRRHYVLRWQPRLWRGCYPPRTRHAGRAQRRRVWILDRRARCGHRCECVDLGLGSAVAWVVAGGMTGCLAAAPPDSSSCGPFVFLDRCC